MIFLNHYFRLQGLEPLAKLQDVALQFPQEQADVALFLKEMPRFARNYGDLGRPLLEALNVHWLVLSFPEISTHGGRNLTPVTVNSWPNSAMAYPGKLPKFYLRANLYLY
ncbi:MAG: hypothetical protein M5U34_23740 [Chloroflexi bacterium]|nr:hypothetical protein [Chloroflexota bacterium]